MNNPDHISETLIKILKFSDVDPGWKQSGSGWKKVGSGIRDKHSGSATLLGTASVPAPD
jgi:hypothetical protein